MGKKIFFIFLTLAIISGCATVGPQKGGPYFYPPLPDDPRLQFLTSFSSSEDIESGREGFSKFILGEELDSKPIVKPYGVTAHKDKIYICDTILNNIEILDLKERTFKYFSSQSGGRFQEPINVAFSSDNKMFVADVGHGQVLVFDSLGQYHSAIGTHGALKPTDVQVYKDRIFVSDLKSNSVRIYDSDNYAFLYSIPKEGQDQAADLFSPTNIDIDSDGNIYVSDLGDFKVKKYDIEGNLLRTFGTIGDTPGQMARPKGIAVDKEDRIYVVDAAFENVQIFDPEGRVLMYFPEDNDPKRLILPAGIDIDYDAVDLFSSYIDKSFEVEYLVYVASQYGDRKINVFGFGRKK